MHRTSQGTRKLFCIISLSLILLSGCGHFPENQGKVWLDGTVTEKMGDEGRPEKNIQETEFVLPEEIIHGMVSIMTGNVQESVTTDSRGLLEPSTEGGEITRYLDEHGNVVRYQLIYYGEIGRTEDNYYFKHDCIYYTGMIVNYTAPIYEREFEIKDRELRQGVLFNKVYYQYDSTNNTFSPAKAAELPYHSLEELEEVFRQSNIYHDEGKNTEQTDF